MRIVDGIVVVAYLALVVRVGIVVQRKQKGSEDFLLAGREMPWWAAAVSILATSFSAAALIGGSAQGFDHGFRYLILQLGDLLAFGLAALLLIPAFLAQPITTAYEWLQRRFGEVARVLASLVFIVWTLVRVGLLIYAPAILLAKLTGTSELAMIVVAGLAALAYSATGGIAAVVWTDLLQLVVIVVGCLLAIAVMAVEVGAGPLWVGALRGGKPIVDLGIPWGQPWSLPWSLLAYGVLALAVAGGNQQPVQRYLATGSVEKAQKAALAGWLIGALVMVLALGLGMAIRAWAELKGVEVLGKDALGELIKGLPMGLAGLLVAGVMAAAMSSIDSAIHSLATSTLVDLILPYRELDDARQLRTARWLTGLYAALAIGIAIYAANVGGDLLTMMVTWLGYFAGPLLGLFLLGLFTRAGQAAAVAAVIVAFGQTAYLARSDALPQLASWLGQTRIHPLYTAPLALVTTLLVGATLGLMLPSGERVQESG